MTTRLTDPVPLRTQADIGLEGNGTVPIIYGRGTVIALPMDAYGGRWIIADHALRGDAIRSVHIDGQPTAGYALKYYTAPEGGPIAILATTGRYPGAEVVVRTWSGRVDRRSGLEITNPADIMRDIITVIAGIHIPSERWAAIRQETHAAGLVCAGVIGNRDVSVKRIIDGIAASVGMIWSPTMRRIGRLLPSQQLVAVKLTEREILSLSAQISLKGSVAEVCYRYRDTGGVDRVESRKTGLLGSVKEIDGAWIVDRVIAARIVDRIAAGLASWRWRVTCTILNETSGVEVGEKVVIEHPYSPIIDALIISRQESAVGIIIEAVG